MSALFRYHPEIGGGKPSRSFWIALIIYTLFVCLYLARLEAHTSADIFLPTNYHSVLDASSQSKGNPVIFDENATVHSPDVFYRSYTEQEGRPYTVRQDLLLSRLAYIQAPQGFQGETDGVTVRKLLSEVAHMLEDPSLDSLRVLGRNREEVLDILAGFEEHSHLGDLIIREYISDASRLTGYVLEQEGELTIALRGTDDMIDQIDNAILLPFNLSVQYATMRELLANYSDVTRIWLTGHSKGGHNAIYAASIDARCHATGFNAPGFGIFLSDAQHDGLDRGVNYVVNGDITGFLLFHMERRVVLDSVSAPAEGRWFNNRHRLDHFFSVDDLSVANRILPLAIWSEWTTQVAWLALVFLVSYATVRLLISISKIVVNNRHR